MGRDAERLDVVALYLVGLRVGVRVRVEARVRVGVGVRGRVGVGVRVRVRVRVRLDVMALYEELVDEAQRRRRGQQLGQHLVLNVLNVHG